MKDSNKTAVLVDYSHQFGDFPGCFTSWQKKLVIEYLASLLCLFLFLFEVSRIWQILNWVDYF